MQVKTGDKWGAGTDANVVIKLFGKTGDTGNMQLKSSDNNKNKFEKGKTDLFKLEATDIGQVSPVICSHLESAFCFYFIYFSCGNRYNVFILYGNIFTAKVSLHYTIHMYVCILF